MKDLLELGREVADALGGWSVEQPDGTRGVYLVGQAEGEKLFVQAEYHNPNSLVISGKYPEVRDYRPEYVRIGCSRTKGAAKIARDIERRLLPEYRVTLAAVVEYRARQEAATEKRESAMQHVSNVLGEPRVMGDGYYSSEVNLGEPLVHGYGSITTTGAADTWHLDLKAIPRDVAMRIVDVLAEARNADLAELLS